MAFRQQHHASKKNPPDLDKFLDELFAEITKELLEKTEELRKLGKLYEKEAAESAARTAARDARTEERDARTALRDTETAERDAKTVEKEIRAAQHLAKAAEYKAMSSQHDKKIEANHNKLKQLEVISTILSTLNNLSDQGTALLKELTPLQIEFKTQVNKRAEFTNQIAARIEACNADLQQGRHDQFAAQLASIDEAFLELDAQVEAENKAQEDVVEVLDRYEALVGEMQSTLAAIQDQDPYYAQFKTKICDVEQRFLDQQNTAFEANRPAKTASDELGEQCRQAFSSLKERIPPSQRQTAMRLPTFAPAREASLPSRSSSDDESLDSDKRSSPNDSPKSEAKSTPEKHPSPLSLASTTAQLTQIGLASSTEGRAATQPAASTPTPAALATSADRPATPQAGLLTRFGLNQDKTAQPGTPQPPPSGQRASAVAR